jgi:hypothetical protein
MTVYRCLTQSPGFVAHHLRWVPHTLSDTQKGEKTNLSLRQLRMLEVQRGGAWHDVVTLDDSWFYLGTDHEFVWFPRNKKVLERERHTIQSKIHVHDRLESARGHLIKVLEKRSQVQRRLLYR